MSQSELQFQLVDAEATEQLGRRLAAVAADTGSLVIYLQGNLGAGKTTLVRGFMRGLGFDGVVRSPTYTLVESYHLQGHDIFHLDLYRLADPEELEYLGIRDLQDPGAILLVEWPQQGEGVLAPADLEIQLDYDEKQRQARLLAHSGSGQAILAKLGS